jgi:hypothetical protein
MDDFKIKGKFVLFGDTISYYCENRIKPIICKVDMVTGCHNVISNKARPDGYVMAARRIIGVKTIRGFSHRIVYEDFVGEITNELEINHSCDNRSCCNPNHLSAATHQVNMADKAKRGRTNFQKSTNRTRSKLTEEQVRFIMDNPQMSSVEIAEKFGVLYQIIYFIRRGDSYADITGYGKTTIRGESVGLSVENHLKVIELKDSHTLQQLAEMFNCSTEKISTIKRGELPKNIREAMGL